jgi:biofilm PGA synthesis N-glycosyltransferase PgaC
MILLVGICFLFIAALPYLIYLIGIHFGKRLPLLPITDNLPNISIIISAYNEAAVIEKRIENLAEMNYPKKNFEIILIDDCSSDNTREIAENAFKNWDLPYTIIHNTSQMGVNRSYNRGLNQAAYNLIITTDADVFFEKDALNIIVTRLLSDPRIAAVCGDLQPLHSSLRQKTGKMEGIYRNLYGRMCEWESAIDSTYNFNGALIAFHKNIITRIEESKGADDANTAFHAIEQGYRSVYEIRAKVFEEIPPNLAKQYRQKIRRATGVIEATLLHINLLKFNRPFSRFFFPLRIMMYTISPVFFFIGILSLFGWIFLQNIFLFILLLIFFSYVSLINQKNFISTFIFNQFFLVIGLLNLRKDITRWESTSKK